MEYLYHAAIVILNYNTEKDLKICAELLYKQTNINFSIILVDNASKQECLQTIKSWLSNWQPNAICGNQAKVKKWIAENPEIEKKSGQIYLIENHENKGYSAGNNIGIRLAEKLGADAVLIVNPDVRIEDTNYLAKLTESLFSNPDYYISASRIIGLDGVEQNPFRESTFWEELFWPRWYLRRFFKNISYILSFDSDKPVIVPKVSGCCLMLKMEFLKKINYLDENIFLYCEEPILAAQVKNMKGNIVFVPYLSAVHAHQKNEKGNPYKRMLLFIKSRKYYLENYSGYKSWQLSLLNVSYAILTFYNQLKSGKD